MKKNNLIRFVQSLVLLPVMSMPIAMANIRNAEIPQALLVQKAGVEIRVVKEAEEEAKRQAQILQAKALAIDSYFAEKGMHLKGFGLKLAQEAEKNGLDWRLLAAISVIETTGANNLCKTLPKDKNKNPFGWGSCKIGFSTFDSAIETVGQHLGGNNPRTAHYYKNKTTVQILRTYNPPSIVPNYAEKVISVMNTISEPEINIALAANS